MYLITYNLTQKASKNYEELFKAIQHLGNTWHDAKALESVWLLKSTKTVQEIYNAIRPNMHNDDYVLIVKAESHQGWMPRDASAWIKT
jgi:hypothetical protein